MLLQNRNRAVLQQEDLRLTSPKMEKHNWLGAQ